MFGVMRVRICVQACVCVCVCVYVCVCIVRALYIKYLGGS
jgi:hypothetical protein